MLNLFISPFNSLIAFIYANKLFVSRPIGSTVSGVATPSRPCMALMENLKYQNLHGNLDFAMKTQYVRAEPIFYGCDEFKWISPHGLRFTAS